MLIASKYEEIWAPEVRDFVYISDKAYSREDILSCEKTMLEVRMCPLHGVLATLSPHAMAEPKWLSPGAALHTHLFAQTSQTSTLPQPPRCYPRRSRTT